jgi:endoglucanase
MFDHFRDFWALRTIDFRRALLAIKKTLPLLASLPLLLGGATGCIGVSAKKSGPVVPGVASAIKKCRSVRPADDGAIDDLEDANNQIIKSTGRDGYWWSAADPKGSKIDMQVTEPGAGGSELAMHITGSTVPGDPAQDFWGVQLGINFVSDGLFYDASKYAGIAFKAKVGKPDSSRAVRFKMADVNTHKDAGICTACWNHFGKDISLTPEWKEYRVTFSGAEQEAGWGDPRPQAITPSKLIALNWQVGPGQTYDIWIDDVTFLDCE